MAEVAHKKWVNGQLRFSPKVSFEDVIAFATELKAAPDGDDIKALAVRSCGEKEYGIIFAIEYDGDVRTHKSMVYRLTDKLKRRFGNDVNWDIAGDCWVIK